MLHLSFLSCLTVCLLLQNSSVHFFFFLFLIAVCKQLEKGIAAVFGPLSSSSAAHVQSICYALEIPHLQTRWDSRDIRDVDYFSINLYPHYLTLSRVFLDLVVHWNWKQFTILYENNDGKCTFDSFISETSRLVSKLLFTLDLIYSE